MHDKKFTRPFNMTFILQNKQTTPIKVPVVKKHPVTYNCPYDLCWMLTVDNINSLL